FMSRVMAALLAVVCVLGSRDAIAQPAQSGGNGAALYTRWCVSCHEQGAVARAPSRDVISALSADRIVEALESGLMRVQGEVLSPDERRAIAAYLTASQPTPGAATVRACDAASAAF